MSARATVPAGQGMCGHDHAGHDRADTRTSVRRG
jgi:hypothetical protein